MLGQLLRLFLVVVGQPGHRVLEVAHPLAKRAAHFGQALGAEDDQGDDADEEQLHGADVGHGDPVYAAPISNARGTAGRPASWRSTITCWPSQFMMLARIFRAFASFSSLKAR